MRENLIYFCFFIALASAYNPPLIIAAPTIIATPINKKGT